MGKNNNLDMFIGAAGLVVGLVGVGYAFGTRSKMAKISDILNCSIDDLANRTEIDIPEEMISRAVERAVAVEAKRAVVKATDDALKDVKKDIHRQVSDAVESEYSNIKESVLKELTLEASKIDAKRVRDDVEKAAKDQALEKFDDNLDDILEKFNGDLENISRIYKSIAGAMNKNNEKEMVFRIG